MEGLQTVFETALTTVQTDAMGFISKAMPVGIAIAGVFISIKLGMKFFKKITG